MCGIVGIWNFDGNPVSKQSLTKMMNVIYHRGPDDEGQFIQQNIGLGHRRLSIIDLSEKGRQPMSNEDGSVWIVYNGEIYNYQTLNKMLITKGHRIVSRCDTETIVHLYEEYGPKCVHFLRGIFSFAIWDVKKQMLFAAVDRFRIKPFYYTRIGDTFVFASELKAIIASGLVPKRLNYKAIHHYLSLQTVPVPVTIYESVYNLPAGYSMVIKNGEMDIVQYWDVSFESHFEGSEEEIKKKLRDLVYESVEIRLMSDVPLGGFLSGGIDSTVVVGIMSELNQGPVKTFSIGYDVGGKAYDDTYYANLVSKMYHTDHSVQKVTAIDVLNEIKNFIRYLDQPSTDAINSYFVSKLASNDVTVVLSGQGSDELFAGYRTFDLIPKFMERENYFNHIPAFLRNYLLQMFQKLPPSIRSNVFFNRFERFFYWYGSFTKKFSTIRMDLSEDEKRSLYSESYFKKINGCDTNEIVNRYYDKLSEQVDMIDKISYLDIKTYLCDVLIRDMDTMSMTFSLETRIPLVDQELSTFALSIPSNLKVHHDRKKYIFIEAMKDLLPREVMERPKLGFAFPFTIWLREELRPLVDFVLSYDHVCQRGFFKYEMVNRLKQQFYTGKTDNYRKIWGMVILELWLRLVHEEDQQFFHQLYTEVIKR